MLSSEHNRGEGDQFIFLSYARKDDDSPQFAPDKLGWVRFFHYIVTQELQTRHRISTRFWRDDYDIPGDGMFPEDIEAALRRAELLVPVVSPSFLSREWCIKELNRFVELHVTEPRDGLRVLKILKHPVDEDTLPAPLRNRGRDFKFYEIEPHKNVEHQYFMYGTIRPNYEQRYFNLIEEIVHEIKERLKKAQTGPPAALVAAQATPKVRVFVAAPPANSAVQEVYVALVKELELKGVAVVPAPSEAFPDSYAEAERLLSASLSSTELVIHLVGETAGKTCDGASEPMVPMQLRRTRDEMVQNAGLKRLIWVADAPGRAAGSHAAFLAALVRFDTDAASLMPVRDDVVTGKFDAFLDQVRRALPKPEEPPRQPGSSLETPTVYIVAHDEDVAFVRHASFRGALRDELAMVIDVPLKPDASAEVRKRHEAERLREADIALVLWGHGDVNWVEERLRLLRAWSALGRARPFTHIVLLLGEPITPEKQDEDPLAPSEIKATAADIRGLATRLPCAGPATASDG